MTRRKLTQEELLSEAIERFGKDPMGFKFQCPQCGDIASIAEFQAATGTTGLAGQDCIGRHLGALDRAKHASVEAYRKAGGRGCDWAAYGLFRGPWEIVIPAEGDRPEKSIWGFPLAPAEVPS